MIMVIIVIITVTISGDLVIIPFRVMCIQSMLYNEWMQVNASTKYNKYTDHWLRKCAGQATKTNK